MGDIVIKKIKEIVRKYFPECKIILFGSRCRNAHNYESDYDILVIIGRSLKIREKRHYESIIRKESASMMIDIDILIRTVDDVEYYRDKIGSITREALKEGIIL